MKFFVLHESTWRIRLRIAQLGMTLRQADLLEYYLQEQDSVDKAKVLDRTGEVVIFRTRKTEDWSGIRSALENFSYQDERLCELVPQETGRAVDRKYAEKLTMMILGRIFRRIFFPAPLRMIWTVAKSIRFLIKGLRALFTRGLDVSVLDAAAITASLWQKDYATAGSVMFLLNIGELLEAWTHKKSVNDLARTMSLKVEKVWRKKEDGEEELVGIGSIEKHDRVVIRTSDIVPLDGKVIEGTVMVNQASMTGESVPAARKAGGYVYAGTVVEEGECTIEVTKTAGSGKYDQIVRMIEESEKLKSNTEARAFHFADKLVPYSLGGTAFTWLLTRNVNRAISFLMVDFSCALKLSMPLAVLSAIKEAGSHDISVKGGKFLEAVAQAETIVFDKTGTLTHETPTVVDVVTFGDMKEEDALRMAACLEEHYPHSMANAVVKAAAERDLVHKEMHSKVEYVVAHGISSRVDGKRALIGSYHFVFEDEKVRMPEGEEDVLRALPDEYTHLYLAIDGVLVAVICIFDPLREEAPEVIRALHQAGFDRVCMMTGDNERTASAVARELKLDEYHAEVLPEEKAAFIKQEHAAGRKVIMVGDGVNDTPSLSEADAGIAIRGGAAIASEVADIIVSAEDLHRLVLLKQLSNALMKRIRSNYRFIMGFNAGLIALSVSGILPPATSALLHNVSTVVTGLRSMTELLSESKEH
ncbi:MAG: heavy metal translocating P-type ATPase [Eubacteriales bacterium]|nr:heavy metal translocating P-type ATPase [Eubacteriales bacterium]